MVKASFPDRGKMKVAVDPSLNQRMHQYQIVGRAAPTQKNPRPKIYRMKLFGKNRVLAKNKFWYFMKRICKAKKSGGEILAINEIFEKHPLTVNNYGIWLRYDSRTGTHNMYKEYRDVTINGAVGQMYQEMAGRHRGKAESVQIIKTAILEAKDCRRDHVTQWHDYKAKFPIIRKMPMVNVKKRSVFNANRPNTFLR